MTFKKIPYKSSAQILPRFKISDDAAALIEEEASVEQTIQVLNDNALYSDLVQFLAHALPVREAIWWGVLCLQTRQNNWSPIQLQCLNSAKSWVKGPSEELRRKCELYSNRLELNCGPSWLAQAVFWNGSGSIVSPELPAVLPDPFLYSKAVAGAVNHSAALPEWDNYQGYIEYAISTGLDIARGGNGKED
ncbi:DUF6931 family protein [Vibrio paucivorans]